MGTELRIEFDGETPGLASHRLSLDAFAEPLVLLLSALRRTATSILTDAEDPEQGDRGGRLARQAELLDLELVSISPGSAEPTFVCVLRPDERDRQRPLFVDDLPARALQRVVNHLGAEGRGERASGAIRRYLRSLPSGITRQRYALLRDGVELAATEFGAAAVAAQPQGYARLVQVVGRVVAIGFEPSSVTMKGSRQVRCEATPELVERAVALRAEEVRGAIIEGKTARLVWLRAAADQPAVPDTASTLIEIEQRWGETMRELAK